MTTQTSESSSEDLTQDLETASVSGGIAALGTLAYYGTQSVASVALEGGLFFVVMLALGTFTFAMIDMILDQPKAFSGWLSQASWPTYSLQGGFYVLLGLGIMALMNNPLVSASTNVLAISVAYITMIGVAIWLTQESLNQE